MLRVIYPKSEKIRFSCLWKKSIPLKSQTNSCSVSSMHGSSNLDQGNLCCSSLFCHKQKPFLSQYRALIMFLLRFVKRYRSPLVTLFCMTSCTRSERPLMDLRISVAPGFRYILRLVSSGNIIHLEISGEGGYLLNLF